MKMYGYASMDKDKLMELEEVSFIAKPVELRKIADFFNSQAESFEADGQQEHVHFSDFIGDRDMWNDVIVCNPKYFPE